MKKYKIASFYKFFDNILCDEIKADLAFDLTNNGIVGTILIAKEGINGTIAGSVQSLDTVVKNIKKIEVLSDIEIKFSYSKIVPFKRLKIKNKKEIVSLGIDNIKPYIETGDFVSPEDWNSIIENKENIIIDTRNLYESSIGSFLNSTFINKNTFRDFPAWVKKNLKGKENKNIAMFCTGGIRCEKASSYLISQGFNNVMQLKGGILKYLEKIDDKNSLWKGECFVFDERVSLVNNLKQGQYEMCHACRMPITKKDMESKGYLKGISCSYCFSKTTKEDKKRFAERQKQIELSKRNMTNHFKTQKNK